QTHAVIAPHDVNLLQNSVLYSLCARALRLGRCRDKNQQKQRYENTQQLLSHFASPYGACLLAGDLCCKLSGTISAVRRITRPALESFSSLHAYMACPAYPAAS